MRGFVLFLGLGLGLGLALCIAGCAGTQSTAGSVPEAAAAGPGGYDSRPARAVDDKASAGPGDDAADAEYEDSH